MNTWIMSTDSWPFAINNDDKNTQWHQLIRTVSIIHSNKVFKSQTSWGTLELKHNRSNQGSSTWIAVFQELLSKAKSLAYSILSSLLLLPLSKSTSIFLCLSSRYYPALGFHYAPVPL